MRLSGALSPPSLGLDPAVFGLAGRRLFLPRQEPRGKIGREWGIVAYPTVSPPKRVFRRAARRCTVASIDRGRGDRCRRFSVGNAFPLSPARQGGDSPRFSRSALDRHTREAEPTSKGAAACATYLPDLPLSHRHAPPARCCCPARPDPSFLPLFSSSSRLGVRSEASSTPFRPSATAGAVRFVKRSRTPTAPWRTMSSPSTSVERSHFRPRFPPSRTLPPVGP